MDTVFQVSPGSKKVKPGTTGETVGKIPKAWQQMTREVDLWPRLTGSVLVFSSDKGVAESGLPLTLLAIPVLSPLPQETLCVCDLSSSTNDNITGQPGGVASKLLDRFHSAGQKAGRPWLCGLSL